MPARAIPLGRRSLTGILPSSKFVGAGHFESSLERDLFMLLLFNPTVSTLEVQPVQIHWEDASGPHRYTPDLLVHYTKESHLCPELFEVKYRNELREKWLTFKPKFKHAYRYAKQHGWNFKIISEREIRTPLLQNVKFLLPYLTSLPDERFWQIRKLLIHHGQLSVKEIITTLSSSFTGQGEILNIIWTMLANHYIQADLGKPLSQNTTLWVTQND